MTQRILYEICPECGFENAAKKQGCPACDNRLFSDTQEEHRRYIDLVVTEHRKRSAIWLVGWIFVGAVFLGPLPLMLTGKIGWAPSGGVLFAALFIARRLIDLQKKRAASSRFLARYRHA